MCTIINGMEKKVIINQKDWLSLYNKIEVPINKTFVHNGKMCEYKINVILKKLCTHFGNKQL